MIRFAMNIKDLELNFARIQFYKPLASKLHPAGAFSLVKTAFLRILNMYNYIVSGFVQYCLAYKFWVSKQHPAGAFSLRKIAFLDLRRMHNSENQSFFSKEVVIKHSRRFLPQHPSQWDVFGLSASQNPACISRSVEGMH